MADCIKYALSTDRLVEGMKISVLGELPHEPKQHYFETKLSHAILYLPTA